jgi:hypothetical protein
MSTGFSIISIAGTGVLINATYTVAHKHDPFPTILAGGLFMGACVLVGGARPEVGSALAAIYLLSTVITRGEYFIGFVEDLTGSQTKVKGK